MLSSIFWSDMPFISFKRWVKELVAVVMTFFVLSESDPRKALQSIFRRTIYILIPFSYILINYFPEYGREYGRWSGGQMWIGVALQKNGLGRLCVFSAFFSVGSFQKMAGKRRSSYSISELRRSRHPFFNTLAPWGTEAHPYVFRDFDCCFGGRFYILFVAFLDEEK
jgi:hypothetical protein